MLSPLRMAWLALAALGAAHAVYRFVLHLAQGGGGSGGLPGPLGVWLDAVAPTAAAWDIILAAVALTVWCVAEVAVRRNWQALAVVPVTFCLGIGCGLPLYLFLRTRPV